MIAFKNTAITILTVCIILFVSGLIIVYGRGYRFNAKEKSFGSTGLMSVTSDPTGAAITIDNKKVGATNTTVTIKPGWYTVNISKEGYQSWEKKIRVQGEVVVSTHAVLFPTNPSLSAITTAGVASPILSPDGSKLAFTMPTTLDATNGADLVDRGGVWILDLIDKPLGLNRDAKQLIKAKALDTTNATLTWSPDSKLLLVDVPTKRSVSSYLLETDRLNDYAKPLYEKETTMKEWAEQKLIKEKEKLLTLSPHITTIATSSMNIISFSPDENKILYEATKSATIPQIIIPGLLGTNSTEETRTIIPKTLYVYDIKEDKNYPIGMSKDPVLQWLPNGRQLLTAGNNKIDVIDYDGTNRKTVYAGPFWDSFVAPWTNASKLIILTNLNPSASTLPNLYAVNIK
jgi:dipeptidyl aminopeptidase/acylaminoacyl peptidase